jgi:hypothetical protein
MKTDEVPTSLPSVGRRALAFCAAAVGAFAGIVVGLAAATGVLFVDAFVFPSAPLEFFRPGALLLALVIGLVVSAYVGVRLASACRRRLANR